MSTRYPPDHRRNDQEISPPSGKARRGFASMTPDRRREIAQKGGKAVSSDRVHMSEIGRKGGCSNSADRSYMSEIGRRGGRIVSQDTAHMSEIGQMGGETTQERKKDKAISIPRMDLISI